MKTKIKMKKKRILCPNCKTGKDSLLIDENSPTCPYLSCYNGYDCGYYVAISTDKDVVKEIDVEIDKIDPSRGFLWRIFDKLRGN